MKKIYSIKVPIFFAAALAATLLISLLARSAYAAITLLYFQARAADPVIVIEWATGTELDTSGFYIGRSQSVDGPFTHLPSPDNPNGFIVHQGDGPIGAEYVLTDTTAQRGVVYYYRLEEIDIHSAVSIYGPTAAGLGVVLPTSTPTATSTATRTSTPTATSTATAKATAKPTSTPEPDSPIVFTPTPQASGLDPSVFVLITPAPVDNPPPAPLANSPATSVPDNPAPNQNNNSAAPVLPPSAPTAVHTVAQNNSIPPVANLPLVAPNTDFVTRSAVAPMVITAPDSAPDTTQPASNGSLLGVLAFVVLLLGFGSVYAIQRRGRN
jgi:hypothetical protein